MANLIAPAPDSFISGSPWRGVKYFSTTRHGGESQGPYGSLNLGTHVGDDISSVIRNRQILAARLPGRPLWLNQVHGTDVVDADTVESKPGANHDNSATDRVWSRQEPDGGFPPQADAAVTTSDGQVLAILTADCLPIVIADVDGRAVGVAHAGWKGLAAGVIEATLNRLRAKCVDARAFRAWIGPAISQRHFEVGPDVRDVFVRHDPRSHMYFTQASRPDKWLADLPGLARERLWTAGVCDVELSGCCTYRENDQFYSYRRSSVTGRIATLAWLCHDGVS